MAETSHLPLPPRPGTDQSPSGRERALGPSAGAGLIALLAVVIGSVLLGLLGGLLWSHLAPRVVYQVIGHGTAEVVNPETSAFIAADGWFCVMAVAGGIVSGLLGYLLAVRRYGALPMLGILGGALAAAYAAMKLGQQTGRTEFFSRLAASKSGALLRAPVMLGSHAALAFWPLAAGLVAGGIEASVLLRERRRAQAQQYAVGPVTPAGPYGSGGQYGPGGQDRQVGYYGAGAGAGAGPGQESAGWPAIRTPQAPGGHDPAPGQLSYGPAESPRPWPGEPPPGESLRPGESPRSGESPWPGESPKSGESSGPGNTF